MRLDCSDPMDASERTDPSEAEESNLIESGARQCTSGRQSPESDTTLSDVCDGRAHHITFHSIDSNMADCTENDGVDNNQNIPFVDDTDHEGEEEGVTNEGLDSSPTHTDHIQSTRDARTSLPTRPCRLEQHMANGGTDHPLVSNELESTAQIDKQATGSSTENGSESKHHDHTDDATQADDMVIITKHYILFSYPFYSINNQSLPCVPSQYIKYV